MTDDVIAQFEQAVLKGKTAPADLRVLLTLQTERAVNPDHYADAMEELGVRVLAPGETHALLAHDYLNDDDRANPDIMCNVEAIDAVAALCSFVVVTDDSDVVGYWHGPEQLDIAVAPIVKLDTEGQFSLLGGRHLTEALVGDRVFDDDAAFAEYREGFAQHGIKIEAENWDALPMTEPQTRPQELHLRLYNEARVKRGLEPVD
jgi:hypothetical protein